VTLKDPSGLSVLSPNASVASNPAASAPSSSSTSAPAQVSWLDAVVAGQQQLLAEEALQRAGVQADRAGAQVAEVAKAVTAAMLEKHILLNRTSETVLRFLPPSLLTTKQVDGAIRALDEAFAARKSPHVPEFAAATEPL